MTMMFSEHGQEWYKGFDAGFENFETYENPWLDNTAESIEWGEGWQAGHDEMVKREAETPEDKEAETLQDEEE